MKRERVLTLEAKQSFCLIEKRFQSYLHFISLGRDR